MHNVTIKEALQALRSGFYQQAFSVLKNKDGFCCLGVVEDIAGTTWKQYPHADYAYDEYHQASMTCSQASEDMGEWGDFISARISWSQHPITTYHSMSEKCTVADLLADMNDGCFSFLEIADWIEIQAKELGFEV